MAKQPADKPTKKKSWSHSFNMHLVQLTTGTKLKVSEDGKFATIFGLHNHYQGPDKEPSTIPYSILIGKNKLNYARKWLSDAVGITIIVQGEITGAVPQKEKDGAVIQMRAETFEVCHKPQTAGENDKE